ncbi:hypothetical protein NHX12_010136 [Muraenolepis orangiensis]|uniref:Nucleophosmin n=1 Tax=Muraenolepis orangiensis TaxID=630683 RepID=A0A9Q0DKK6_9TELE|nr:hypothetical protein NHX12_010136 [Muraenolepis orangiensis]
MNGIDEGNMAPQNFLYGCKLEAGKEIVFNPEDDDFEHQLDLRMACIDTTTKDELHVVEVEGQDEEGQKVLAVLASLKPSTLPSVCLGGFTITPPAVFRLKSGSGPVHISGQHLVKAKKPAQNGKSPKPTTPAKNQNQPKSPKQANKSPKTPRKTPTLEEVKQQLMAFVKKGSGLPKIKPKFENLMKNAYKVTDTQVLEDLWKWKQTLKE